MESLRNLGEIDNSTQLAIIWYQVNVFDNIGNFFMKKLASIQLPWQLKQWTSITIQLHLIVMVLKLWYTDIPTQLIKIF